MNHVYFTSRLDGADLAAELVVEQAGAGQGPRVYEVEPTGSFEDGLNVTDKKFPGTPPVHSGRGLHCGSSVRC